MSFHSFNRMKAAGLLFAAALFALATQAQAATEKRVALVIGNGAYVHASELKNPASDAAAMAERLEALDFQVIKGTDLDENAMRRVVNEFAQAITTANVGVLFYAGHGLQVEGQNYLLPINAELKNEIDLQFQGVNVNFLLRIMESPNRTSIVLLDACRNNPLAERLARSMNKTRSSTVSSGLARIETGVGTYIGFSTSPDSVALDGEGENSPFTTALVARLDTEGQDIETVMRNVRSDVIAATNGSQVPWGNSSLVGRGFVFRAATEKPAAAVATTNSGESSQLELAYWNAIKDQNDVRQFVNYITKYPNGAFADIARLKIEDAFGVKDKAAQTEKREAAAEQATSQNRNSAAEAVYWQSIQNSSDPRFFEAYLAQFPNGAFATLAKLKIDVLGGKKVTETAAVSSKVEKTEPVAEKTAEVTEKVAEVAEATEKIAAAEEERGIEIASLDTKNQDARSDKPEIVSTETVLEIQRELDRIGCDVGRPDGKWGNRSRNALEQAGKFANLQFASLEPTNDLLGTLKKLEDRVCPLVCGSGFIESGGKCEQVAQPAAKSSPAKSKTAVVTRPAKTVKKKVTTKIFSPAPKRKRPVVQDKGNKHMPFGIDSDGAQM